MCGLLHFNDSIFLVDENKLKNNKPHFQASHSEYVSKLLGEELIRVRDAKETNVLQANNFLNLELVSAAFFFKNGFTCKNQFMQKTISFQVISILALHNALNYTDAVFELQVVQLDLHG